MYNNESEAAFLVVCHFSEFSVLPTTFPRVAGMAARISRLMRAICGLEHGVSIGRLSMF